MRVAIIDLGTNTFNLLVAETGPDSQYSMICNRKVAVKLGEGGINKGVITPAAFARGLTAIRDYAELIDSLGVERTQAFATSAVRNASNGSEFVAAVAAETGIQIEVISGSREAEFIYLGVRQAVALSAQPSLIMDIGGGSTEFIIADANGIRWKQSFEVGAARLLDRFAPSDPLTAQEQAAIMAYLRELLQPLFDAAQAHPITELIGASGSFDSLAELVVGQFHPPGQLEGRSNYTFDLTEVAVVHSQLIASTKAERIAMKDLIAMRVDMIVVSTLLVEVVLQELQLKQMRLSTFALKEGALCQAIARMNE